MSEKSELINKLKNKKEVRKAYVRAKISVNLPSQIRAIRLKQKMKQEELAQEAEMKQPRISAMERPGATKFNIETLIRLAAAFKVGLIVKFVPFSEMLSWENEFSQDTFRVVTIDKDIEFQKEEKEEPAIALPELFLQHGIFAGIAPSVGTESLIPQPGVPGEEPDYSKKLYVPTGWTFAESKGASLGRLSNYIRGGENTIIIPQQTQARNALKLSNSSASGSQKMPVETYP